MNPQTNSIADQVILVLADTYGVDPEEIEVTSDLIEDIDLKSDPDTLGRFIEQLNRTFDIELDLSDISEGIDDENITIIQDIVNEVEDALLE